MLEAGETSDLIGEVQSQLRLRFTDLGVPQPWATDEGLFQSLSVFSSHLAEQLRKNESAAGAAFSRAQVVLNDLHSEIRTVLESPEVVRLLTKPESGDRKTSVSGKERPVDILVITAMCSPELSELLKVIEKQTIIQPFRNSNHAACYQGTLAGTNATVVAATQDDMGMANAAVLTTKLIIHFRPRFVVMTGIAAGINPKKQQVGDILVTTHTYDLALGKLEREADFAVFRPKMHQKDARDHFRYHNGILAAENDTELKETIQALLDASYAAAYKLIVRKPMSIHHGPFGSGGTVIADPEEAGTYKTLNADLIGFDMEAHAVVTAAAECGLDDRPQVLIAKAICDFAGSDKGKNKEEKQLLAARASAEFFRLFFAKYVLDSATPRS